LVLIEGSGELGNCRGDLYSAQEDSFLSLENDVFGPLDEPGEVASGQNVVADSEVARAFLEERVALLLDLLATFLDLLSFSHSGL
jgi:hypothetical protein